MTYVAIGIAAICLLFVVASVIVGNAWLNRFFR